MNATIPAIRGQLADAQVKARESYRQLVLALADGAEVDFDEIEEIVSAAELTIDDLERHIALASSRRQATAEIVRADQLAATVAELQQSEAAAAQAVREQEQRNREALRPLQATWQAAHETLRETQREAGGLRTTALGALNKTLSPEKQGEHATLSNTACNLKLQLQADLHRRDARARETNEATRTIAQCEADLQSFDDRATAITVTAREKVTSELTAARDKLARLEREAAEVDSLQVKAAEAAEALARFERKDFLDWRNVSFE